MLPDATFQRGSELCIEILPFPLLLFPHQVQYKLSITILGKKRAFVFLKCAGFHRSITRFSIDLLVEQYDNAKKPVNESILSLALIDRLFLVCQSYRSASHLLS